MGRLWILILAGTLAYGQAVVIRTSTLLDGKGHVLKNTDLEIEGGHIIRIGAARGKATIDLTGMTVMPGWIDTHVHATWYFNREERLEQGGPGSKSTPQQAALSAAANLYETVRRVHDGTERRGRTGRRPARTDRGGSHCGTPATDVAAAGE
jgi:imidazolonepropionase-like amidohydrolase